MAGSSARTEKPTPKRLQDAREKGQVAKSQDLNAAVTLGTATLMLGYLGPYTYNTVYAMVEHTLRVLPDKPMTFASFSGLFVGGVQSVILLILPFFIAVAAMAVLSNLIQVKPLFSVQVLMPKWDKLNPLNGVKRLWSLRSVVEIGKALIKMAIVGACGWSIIQSHQQELMALGNASLPGAWAVVVRIVGDIALWSFIIFLVLGFGDWWYQKFELEKQLRMSRQEIKDERKNAEGDPAMKGKIRQFGMQMVRKRQLAAIPTADVIITNPTHFSVAIKYDPDIAPAPRVVAKGQDHFALKIREVAKEHGVPIIENKPVARSLYATVEVDHMVPPELFVAVAEVLAFVYSRKKSRKVSKPRHQAIPPIEDGLE